MNRNLAISIAVGLAVFFGAMLRSHLTDEAWRVSPSQLATAAKNGILVQSENGGITGRPIQKSNAHWLKYKWTFMGLLAGFACFQWLHRGVPAAEMFNFSWRKDKFYWKVGDYPELNHFPEAQAKERLSVLHKKHAINGMKQELAEAKGHFVAYALMLVAYQTFFGFDMGAALFLGTFFAICWAKAFGQRIPKIIRAELQAEEASGNRDVGNAGKR